MERKLVGLTFNTIGVSDGITNGTDVGCVSLVSRDVIADSIETVVGAQWYDGLIAALDVIKYAGICNGYGEIKPPSDYGVWRFTHSGKWKGRIFKYCSAFQLY
jgi:dihydroxy-acid dehydratase